jgi:hypothetical protein
VKKLISIGVALALLTMAVVPGAVAAQDPIEPSTFAKIPFAIIGSGLELFADLWTIADPALGIGMTWIADVLDIAAPWTAGPLAWSVDMLAWGVGLVGEVIGAADALVTGMGVTLPFELGDLKAITDTIACGLVQPWSDNITGSEFAPCP